MRCYSTKFIKIQKMDGPVGNALFGQIIVPANAGAISQVGLQRWISEPRGHARRIGGLGFAFALALAFPLLLFEGWIGGRSAMLLQLAFRIVKGFARQRQHVKGHGVISSELFKSHIEWLGAIGLGLKAHHTLCHFDPGHHVSLCNAWAQILFFSLSVGLTEGTQAASMRLAAAATDHQPRGKKLKPLVPEFKSVHRVTCLEGSFPPLPSKFSHAWKVPPLPCDLTHLLLSHCFLSHPCSYSRGSSPSFAFSPSRFSAAAWTRGG